MSLILRARKWQTAIRLVEERDWRGVLERLKLVLKKAKALVWPARKISANPKERFLQRARIDLEEFLFSSGTLCIPTVDESPRLSILLVLFNKAELTFQCLRSLAETLSPEIEAEVIVIDNDSRDDTDKLLAKVRGLRVIKNSSNVGFLRACNQALEFVKGEFLLLLNNDATVAPGAIDAAIRRFATTDNVGAVGGRIVLPDGTLQEAGCIQWNDGTNVGFGRARSPRDSEFLSVRSVDYCSGAFLMTRTEYFQKTGGFDERYLPAYYEETDFCTELKKMGLQIVYEPRCLVHHFEFGSSSISQQAFRLMESNRHKFLAKHYDYLRSMPGPSSPDNYYLFKNKDRFRKKVLVIEDRIPLARLGAGFPRAQQILKEMSRRDVDVTFYSTVFADEKFSEIFSHYPDDWEYILGKSFEQVPEFIQSRPDFYEYIWVSRPHNIDWLSAIHWQSYQRKAKLVYDAEAMFSRREKLQAELFGQKQRPSLWRRTQKPETELAVEASLIVSVCDDEASEWKKKTGKPVFVVGHDFDLDPTDGQFGDRRDILIFGSMHGHPSPNSDAFEWFMKEVWSPFLKNMLPEGTKIRVLGYNTLLGTDFLKSFEPDAEYLGSLDDVRPIFDRCRIMVVPTRFAAGIPQKVYDGAKYGIPMVCTDLIASQMLWAPGQECLAAPSKEPKLFAEACRDLYSRESLWNSVRASMLSNFEIRSKTHSISTSINRVFDSLDFPTKEKRNSNGVNQLTSEIDARQKMDPRA